MVPIASCPKCGYNLYGRVTVNNLMAEIGANIKNNAIEYKPSRIHAENVEVEFIGFFCPSCHKDVKLESAVFRCIISGLSGPIADFAILRFNQPSGKAYNKPYVVHKDHKRRVIDDMARENYVLKSDNPITTAIKADVEGG